MSFSRCRTLLNISKFISKNTDINDCVGKRFYNKKNVILTSEAARKFRSKPSNYKHYQKNEKEERYASNNDSVEGLEEIEEIHGSQVRKKIVVSKKNFRLDEDEKYQPDEVFEIIKMKEDPNVDKDTHLFKSEGEEDIDNFKSERLYEEKLMKALESLKDSKDDSNQIDTKEIAFTKNKLINTPEGKISFNLAQDEFKMREFIEQLNQPVPKPLDEFKEDLSFFGPEDTPTFNFASLADKSKVVQEFVHLGVDLHKIEKNQHHMQALMSVDIEKDLPLYLRFLHDCGVPADSLGKVITECPLILKEDLEDMKVRIRYLKAHNFHEDSISRIITANPMWLLWATKLIDERLGHFQNEFKLKGSEVRFLAARQPKLITYNFRHIHENTFAVREQMGFNAAEMKIILLLQPKIWMMSRKKIVDAFDYLHNVMKLPHLLITAQCKLLTCRKNRLSNRHEFLQELKKAQYDPKLPGYISPIQVVSGSDADFCRDVAKVSIETYNLFLKTR